MSYHTAAAFYAESGSSPPSLDDPRIPQRVREKIEVDPGTDCWLWTASRHQSGYGQVWLSGRARQAHRAVYELLRGPVPRSLVLDHVACDNPACCNPAHLRVTTTSENTRRGYERIRAGHAPSTAEANRRGPARRAWDRRQKERRLAEGRCMTCGSMELATKYRCASCAGADRQRSGHRKAELVTAGFCQDGCGRPLAPGSSRYCAPCRENRCDRNRRWRARQREKAAA